MLWWNPGSQSFKVHNPGPFPWSKHPEHMNHLNLKKALICSESRITLFWKLKARNKITRNKKACEKISLLIVSLKGGCFSSVLFSMSSNLQWIYCEDKLHSSLSRFLGKITSFSCPCGVACCQLVLQSPC